MGIGIDIVEINKISGIIDRWGGKFLNRVFTDGELKEWKLRGERVSFLAGRFATKEAFLKATSFKVSKWKDIETLGASFESPTIRFQEKDLKKVQLSISHTNQLAIAVVIIQ